MREQDYQPVLRVESVHLFCMKDQTLTSIEAYGASINRYPFSTRNVRFRKDKGNEYTG